MSGGSKAAFGGGGIIVVLLTLYGLFSGNDTSTLINVIQGLGLDGSGGGGQTEQRDLTDEEVREKEFASTILAYTEDAWTYVFKNQLNKAYEPPTLVLFSGQVDTYCGGATSSVGPFYCPADKKVYLDMSFFNELKSQFGAKIKSKVDSDNGEFAVAYVIAHEVGHHVQNLLGTSEQVRRKQQQARSEAEANRYSVALELQADFYAGVFTHYVQQNFQILENGDIESAISAAEAVGDDAIQKRVRGTVVPDAFTHGSSEQRIYWFKLGYSTGDMRQGDTFSKVIK
jgi:predicted metalloprotease